MKIKELISFLNEKFPLSTAEEFDNVGLLIGNSENDISKVLISHDTTLEVVIEAIDKGANLIISFHPIIFSSLKKLTGKTYVEKVVMKCIENKISVFAIHTSMDNNYNGVNKLILDNLGARVQQVLMPKKNLSKLTTYIPKKKANELVEKLSKAGAGKLGNYSNCNFGFDGVGTFKGNEYSNPSYGKVGELHFEEETCVNMLFENHLKNHIEETLLKNHPYEEVAFEVIPLDIENKYRGLGMIGIFEKEISQEELLEKIKLKFKIPFLKHSKITSNKVNKIAVLGGSGGSLLNTAIKNKVDAYITSDLKYHDFFKAENKLLLIDAGHYETERFVTKEILRIISEKYIKLAVSESEKFVNPINYYG